MQHGSPEDRGSADAYYGRPFNPHYYRGANRDNRERVGRADMTDEEIAEYTRGYDNEDDRKDYR